MLRMAKDKEPSVTPKGRTPLTFRAVGVSTDAGMAAYAHDRADRRLCKFAWHIEQLTVLFEDVNGPKGGVDIECRIKAALKSAPTVVVTERGETAREAFDLALGDAEAALRRTLGRRGWSAGGRDRKGASPAERSGRSSPRDSVPDDDALIGRRVGHAEDNLRRAAERPEKKRRDVPVDTAAEGASASDRRAGGRATAARNTITAREVEGALLEDSRLDRPSRKSTRRSAGSVKRDAPQRQAQTMQTRSPEARARKSQVRRPS